MEWSWRAITGKPKEKADESRFSFTLNIASPPPHFYPNPADAIFSLFSLAPGDSREVPPVNLRLVSVARSRMRLFEPPIQKLGVFALFASPRHGGASQKTMPAFNLKTRSKTHPLAWIQRLTHIGEPLSKNNRIVCFEGFTEDDGPSERRNLSRDLRRARKTYYPVIF